VGEERFVFRRRSLGAADGNFGNSYNHKLAESRALRGRHVLCATRSRVAAIDGEGHVDLKIGIDSSASRVTGVRTSFCLMIGLRKEAGGCQPEMGVTIKP
jgi:hypothetical protein